MAPRRTYSAAELRSLGDRNGLYSALVARYPAFIVTLQTVIIQLAAKAASLWLSNKAYSTWTASDFFVGACTGALYINPILSVWFGFTNQRDLSPISKLALDQLVFSPFFTFGIILFSGLVTGIIEGGEVFMPGGALNISYSSLSPPPMVSTAVSLLIKIVPMAWVYWVPMRAVLNRYAPPAHQMLFNSIASFFWTCAFNLATKTR